MKTYMQSVYAFENFFLQIQRQACLALAGKPIKGDIDAESNTNSKR